MPTTVHNDYIGRFFSCCRRGVDRVVNRLEALFIFAGKLVVGLWVFGGIILVLSV